MADLFISHSSRDGAFARQLHDALVAAGRDAWIYTHDVPALAEWLAEIPEGIEGADNFVFITTPASVASRICRKDLEYAASCRKRLVPILREPVGARTAHENLDFCTFRVVANL